MLETATTADIQMVFEGQLSIGRHLPEKCILGQEA